MIRKNIETALATLRDTICEELCKELKEERESCIQVHVELPADHATIVTAIRLDDENNVIVDYYDDLDGEKYSEDLIMFSIDEMLEIVWAI